MYRDIREGFSEMITFKPSLEGHAGDVKKYREGLENCRYTVFTAKAIAPVLNSCLLYRLLLLLRR